MWEVAEFELLDEAFDGGCAVPLGFELTEPNRTRGRWRRSARFLVALTATLLLHGSLVLLWRSARAPSLATGATDPGAGGIQLSLVSGKLGAPIVQETSSADAEPQKAVGKMAAAPIDPAAMVGVSGDMGADAVPNAEGHASGALGAGETAAAGASAGGGYDPGAFASLAPLSFAKTSEPGFLDQVRRCFQRPPTREVALTVVLDDAGVFIDAYKDGGSMQVSAPPPEETMAMALTLDALKACSPYHDLPMGVARRLVLVVPSG